MNGTPNETMGRILRLSLLLLTFACLVPSSRAQMPAAGPVFNVLSYGAKNDGSAPATEAFRKAIAAARAAGGGTIYVPAGHYTSGPIELFSNMTLDIDAGATIHFPVAPLPFVKSRYLGVETLMPAPLIGGTDVENVAVIGRGILTTGDYGQWATAYGPAPQITSKSENANGPHWDHLLKALDAGRPVIEADYRAAAPELRPSFICFTRAKNVLVDGIRVVGAPMFVVHLLYSTNATVNNVMIEALGGHVNGIVADSSSFVRITNDYIDTGDDGIVIKAGKDADGLRVNRPSENIAITNCTVHHAHGAVVIGSETSGSIRNVVASNILADGTENGIRIKSRRGRGGTVEDVRFDNWTMQNVGTGIEVTTYYIMGGESATAQQPVSARTPVFRNIAISNITIRDARQVADLAGLPEMPISNLRLSNVIGSGASGLQSQFTKDLQLHDVEIDTGHGPAFAISAATNLDLDDITSHASHTGSPVVALNHCTGALLRNSRALPGTGTFLSAPAAELKSITLLNNHLHSAQTATAPAAHD